MLSKQGVFMKTFVALCTALAALAAVSAHAGAFGVEMGTPVAKLHLLDKGKTVGALKIYTIQVPMPNSEFEAYQAVVSDTTGVCKVVAIGKTHSDDKDGAAIRPIFDKFQTVLAGKYGTDLLNDFLKDGALWKEDYEFAAAINNNERVLQGYWDTRGKGVTLPQDLDAIVLEANAPNLSDTYLTLSYQFSNFGVCSSKQDAVENSGL